MIKDYYPNPLAKKHTVRSHTHTPSTIYSPHEYRQAAKFKIPPSDYRARAQIVKEAFDTCKFKAGDVGYPYSVKEYEKMGQVRVLAVCDSYDNYGSIEWNDPPFILAVASLDSPNGVTNCSANWVVSEAPSKKVSNVC